MKKIDEYYIAVGFAWLIFGMLFGMWLGATENRQFANSHAHANLGHVDKLRNHSRDAAMWMMPR